ncbi:UNVERIFIED_ORG: hypothetical protein J2806_004458 [Kosakonia oryzae]|nr:hypothetical protein [Kosakonia oryzae]SKC22355.1 hypothetical protein SAMN05216168_4388 [Kosakonia radicincitans]VVT49483.1 hypothetical protein UYSO10_2844 [Kosakonia radicincitans]
MELTSLKSLSLEFIYLCLAIPDITLNAGLAQ